MSQHNTVQEKLAYWIATSPVLIKTVFILENNLVCYRYTTQKDLKVRNMGTQQHLFFILSIRAISGYVM